MARIAVVFGTTNGQTAKISRRIVEVLRTEGHVVELLDTRAGIPDAALVGVQAVVIAGSVKMGKFPRQLIASVREHLGELLGIPTAFVPVSLSAARKNSASAQREVQKTTARFVAETGLNPGVIQPTAGALVYSRYAFFTKLVMRFLSKMTGGDTDTSRDYEYTDWNAVDDFARQFADDTQKLFGREFPQRLTQHRELLVRA
jgi:menaquinone-dependent protoporphyrinogen oxidase